MPTNQFDWVAPTWPVFGSPESSYAYSILGVGITLIGSESYANYPYGIFGGTRYGIGAFFFDNAPVELANLTLSQSNPSNLHVQVGFDLRDSNSGSEIMTYEWRLASGVTFYPAILTYPLSPISGTPSFVHYDVFWDVRSEPLFMLSNAPQNIVFRVTANDGVLIREIESPPTLIALDSAPTIISMPPTIAYKNVEYIYQPVAFDPQSDINHWVLLGAPVDMSFNSSTGKITWKPKNQDIGPLSLTLKVYDTRGLMGSQSFILNVQKKQEKFKESLSYEHFKKNVAINVGSSKISKDRENN